MREEYDEQYKKVIPNQPCLDTDGCGSSDAMAIYIPENEDMNAHCFSCNKNFNKKELESLCIDSDEDLEEYLTRTKPVKKSGGELLTDAQIEAVLKRTGSNGNGFRGIDDETLKFYRIRTEFKDGEVFKRYYPNTIDYKPSSFHVRVVKEKMFFFMGKAGRETDFFGQRLFKDGGKRLLIVGGQEDCAAAQQMLWSYRKKKGSTGYGRDAVVSVPSGENCVASIEKHYAWLDTFGEIILGLDNDEVGREAAQKAAERLPKGKVRIASWSGKDPNAMLEAGQQTEFVDNFFRAKQYVPIGILDTTTLADKLRETIILPKVNLPEFMMELQALMAGGIPMRKIVNIAAETGIGKTSLVNEIVYHWMFSPNIRPAVVTLELDAPEYAMSLLSRHIGKKLSLFDDAEKALNYVNQPWVKEKEHTLYFHEDGSPRWYLIDDRSCKVESIISKVEELVVSFGCNVIVFDPLSDLIARRPLDEQEDFMAWQKNMKKMHDVIFLNVNHVRGSSTALEKGQDRVRFITEDDMMGSTSIPKSADCNILLSRNKYSEDVIKRNTTEVWIPKCRWTGRTGSGGDWYYDNDKHKLYDLEYFTKYVQEGGQNEENN